MPVTLDNVVLAEKNKLEITDPWIYMAEVEVTTGVYERFTNYVTDIVWNSQTWKAFAFMPSSIKTSSNGEVQMAQVTVANPAYYLTAYLKANNGLTGMKGNIYKLSKKYLTNPSTRAIANKFKIVTSSLIEDVVVFNLSLGVDMYGVQGPVGDFDLENFPHLPYGPPRISIGVI